MHSVRLRSSQLEAQEQPLLQREDPLRAPPPDDNGKALSSLGTRFLRSRRPVALVAILAATVFVFVVVHESGSKMLRRRQVPQPNLDVKVTAPRLQRPPSSVSSSSSQPPATTIVIIDANFDTDEDGFVYRDDTFRGTSRPDLASGIRLPTGELQVQLQGQHDETKNNVRNFSGGWERQFSLEQDVANVKLSFRFQLHQGAGYLRDEISEALASIDGRLIGQAPYDTLTQLIGPSGKTEMDRTTGWKQFEVNVGPLSAGEHTLILGGFVNKQSKVGTSTTVKFDDVLLVATTESVQDPSIGPHLAVDRLELSRFKENIKVLTAFGDRWWSTPSFTNAEVWAEKELTALGYSVQRDAFKFEGANRNSLYVDKVGTKFPDRMFIVSAHLDGRGWGGAADDDASGCSAVLEIASILAAPDIWNDITIRLVLWNNEEQGCKGSKAYSHTRMLKQGIEDPPGSGLYPEPTWLGMLQHDMILYDHGLPAEKDQIPDADADIEYQARSIFGKQSKMFADALLAGNKKYATYYPAKVGSDMTKTDSFSFTDVAPSASIRENQRSGNEGFMAMNPQWHGKTDVYASYSEADYKFGFSIVQTSLGTIAELAGLHVRSADTQ